MEEMQAFLHRQIQKISHTLKYQPFHKFSFQLILSKLAIFKIIENLGNTIQIVNDVLSEIWKIILELQDKLALTIPGNYKSYLKEYKQIEEQFDILDAKVLPILKVQKFSFKLHWKEILDFLDKFQEQLNQKALEYQEEQPFKQIKNECCRVFLTKLNKTNKATFQVNEFVDLLNQAIIENNISIISLPEIKKKFLITYIFNNSNKLDINDIENFFEKYFVQFFDNNNVGYSFCDLEEEVQITDKTLENVKQITDPKQVLARMQLNSSLWLDNQQIDSSNDYSQITSNYSTDFLKIQKQNQLILEIISIMPDNKITNFKVGDTFMIDKTGWNHKNNKNENKKEGCVLIGRYKPELQHNNDIELDNPDSMISSQQCQIVYSDDKFKLVCTSQANLTMIQIFDELISLKQGMIIQFGSFMQFFVKDIEDYQGQQPENIKQKSIAVELIKESISQLTASYQTTDQNQLESFLLQSQTNDQIIIGSKLTLSPIQDSNVSNEFILDTINSPFVSDGCVFTFGRKRPENKKNKIVNQELSSNQISEIQCSIIWKKDEGWKIGEKLIQQQDKFSLNGTYYAVKSMKEFKDKLPSQKLELQHKMVFYISGLSFKVIEI